MHHIQMLHSFDFTLFLCQSAVETNIKAIVCDVSLSLLLQLICSLLPDLQSIIKQCFAGPDSLIAPQSS